MSLKNVVKVMNFHSLLRVDKSRRKAKKYSQMENMVLEMLDNILNNRNIILDIKALKPDTTKPELVIYMGSDLGFCGNLNNLVRHTFHDHNGCKNVIVGRKLAHLKDENTILFLTREEFNEKSGELLSILSHSLRFKDYSSIRLVYNHYRNASQVDFVDKVIFPMPTGLFEENSHHEDFVCEGEMQEILLELVELYIQYEVEIASEVCLAAENITRQNITTESLKKIDERDAEKAIEERRAQKDKEFAKVLDNYTKLKHY